MPWKGGGVIREGTPPTAAENFSRMLKVIGEKRLYYTPHYSKCAQTDPNYASKINKCPRLVLPLMPVVCYLSTTTVYCVLHRTFSLKMGFPESSARCMNSRWSVPNSARMLLPADAHPQFQLVPLYQKAKQQCEYHHPRCVPQQPATMATGPLYEQVLSHVEGLESWQQDTKKTLRAVKCKTETT